MKYTILYLSLLLGSLLHAEVETARVELSGAALKLLGATAKEPLAITNKSNFFGWLTYGALTLHMVDDLLHAYRIGYSPATRVMLQSRLKDVEFSNSRELASTLSSSGRVLDFSFQNLHSPTACRFSAHNCCLQMRETTLNAPVVELTADSFDFADLFFITQPVSCVLKAASKNARIQSIEIQFFTQHWWQERRAFPLGLNGRINMVTGETDGGEFELRGATVCKIQFHASLFEE